MNKRNIFSLYIACLALISSFTLAQAQFGPPSTPLNLGSEPTGTSASRSTETKSSLLSSATSVAAGESFYVALRLEQPDGWHSYYHNDGVGVSQSPVITWTLPEGFSASPLIFPAPHPFDSFGMTAFGYEGTHYFLTKITASKDASVGETFPLIGHASWQICSASTCLTQKAELSLNTTISESTISNPTYSEELSEYRQKYIPTLATPDTWKISATDSDKQIEIKITSDTDLPNDLVFYEYNGQLDAQKPINLNVAGKNLTISGAFNLGNDFSPKAAKKLSHISGTLHSPSTALVGDNHSVFITTAWNESLVDELVDAILPESENEQPHSSPPVVTEDKTKDNISNRLTAKEIAEMYDTDSKISIITLDRIDEDGNALDDEGNIIAKENLFTDNNGNITDKNNNIIGAADETTFIWAVLLIFGGGLILNLMPCVFPVLGIKVLGFVQLSGNDPKKIKMHGIVFTLGVVVSMWILAAVILTIRETSGQGVAWGNQMKNPVFVGSMIILMTLFALNLYGVFEVGTSLTSAGGNLHAKKGYEGSFFSGVLTTLIATPCGAPLLATAMTYTLQQTVYLAMILFTIFGLGVASPYLLLSFFPKLIDKLPRPGNWMVIFKKSMAFPLLATVVFLMTAFITQTGSNGIILMLWSLVILATAAFIYGTWGTPMITKIKRYSLGYGLALVFTAGGAYIGYSAMQERPAEYAAGLAKTEVADTTDIHAWADWVPAIVDYHRSRKHIVWIDYTADW